MIHKFNIKSNRHVTPKRAKYSLTAVRCQSKFYRSSLRVHHKRAYRWTKPSVVSFKSTQKTNNNRMAKLLSNRAKMVRPLRKDNRRKLINKNGRIKTHCIFYCRFGRCYNGKKCPFIHDPEKIAVCTRFLRGKCKLTECPFSHKISPEKMPVCSYYIEGRCNSDSCQYRHVNVGPNANICEKFNNGYCANGTKCTNLHYYVCIDFYRHGKCAKRDECTKPHVGKNVGCGLREMIKDRKPILTRKAVKKNMQNQDSVSAESVNAVSRNGPLPEFIPIGNSKGLNGETAADKTLADSVELHLDIKVQKKLEKSIKYFFIDDDDSRDSCLIDDDSDGEISHRPKISILPSFIT